MEGVRHLAGDRSLSDEPAGKAESIVEAGPRPDVDAAAIAAQFDAVSAEVP